MSSMPSLTDGTPALAVDEVQLWLAQEIDALDRPSIREAA
jgi:hypothetical protein